MKIKKEIILKRLQEMEEYILDSLRDPSYDGMFYGPIQKDIKGFIKADVVSIAKKILNNFPENTLDKNEYNNFLEYFIAVFNTLEISKTQVHYCTDYSASCGYLLEELMANWDSIVKMDPATNPAQFYQPAPKPVTLEQNKSNTTEASWMATWDSIINMDPTTNPAQFYQPAPKPVTLEQNKSNTTEAMGCIVS